MRTRQSYLNEIIAYMDGYIDEPYIENLHRQVRHGLCFDHRARLDEEISSVGLPPANEVGKTLLRRACRVSTIPAPSVWQTDPDLRERLVAVYTEYVWDQVNGRRASTVPTEFRSQDATAGTDPFVN